MDKDISGNIKSNYPIANILSSANVQAASSPNQLKNNVASSVAMQKIASLPSLAAGLMSPAAVAKATLVNKQASSGATQGSSSSIAQQLSLIGSSQENTSILIKTTKTNSVGQPTYVAISIPTQPSTSTGQRQVIPLTIHQLKIKQSLASSSEQAMMVNKPEGRSPATMTKLENSGGGTSQSHFYIFLELNLKEILFFFPLNKTIVMHMHAF